MRIRRGLTALVAMVATPLLAQSPVQPAGEIARRLQARYDTVRDFTADFSHTYAGGVLKKTTTERGTLQVKKPGRMRWEYVEPEHKLFVSDGRKIYSYIPADKQVIISPMPADDQATTAVLFLVGKGNLTRDFDASYDQGGRAGHVGLEAHAEAAPARLRLADSGCRPRVAAHSDPRGRGTGGWPFDLRVHQLSGKHRFGR